MAAPFQTRLFGLAATVEGTYGSDASPTFGSNAIRLEAPPDGPSLQALSPNTREDAATGGLGQHGRSQPSGLLHEWTYEIVALGAGSAYSASNLPNIDPILQTAFAQTVDTTSGSETVTYTPSDAPETGVTLYTEKANKKYITLGSVLTGLVVRADAGQHPVWEATMRGIKGTRSEQALEAATYSTVSPPVYQNSSTTINPGTDGGSSYTTGVIRSWELDLGLEAADRADGNAADAYQGLRIVRRQPVLTVTLEVDALSNFDPADLWENATQIAYDTTIGGTKYERYDFDFDDARVNTVNGPQDQDGLEVYEVEMGLFSNSGEEVTILFD